MYTHLPKGPYETGNFRREKYAPQETGKLIPLKSKLLKMVESHRNSSQTNMSSMISYADSEVIALSYGHPQKRVRYFLSGLSFIASCAIVISLFCQNWIKAVLTGKGTQVVFTGGLWYWCFLISDNKTGDTEDCVSISGEWMTDSVNNRIMSIRLILLFSLFAGFISVLSSWIKARWKQFHYIFNFTAALALLSVLCLFYASRGEDFTHGHFWTQQCEQKLALVEGHPTYWEWYGDVCQQAMVPCDEAFKCDSGFGLSMWSAILSLLTFMLSGLLSCRFKGQPEGCTLDERLIERKRQQQERFIDA